MVCDRCGERIDVDPLEKDPLRRATPADARRLQGRIEPCDGRRFCPGCAGAFLERKRETDRGLRELAVAETIGCDVLRGHAVQARLRLF